MGECFEIGKNIIGKAHWEMDGSQGLGKTEEFARWHIWVCALWASSVGLGRSGTVCQGDTEVSG